MEFRILQCKRFIAPSLTSSKGRLIHNYEFDFYPKASRTLYIDDVENIVTDGCICFRRPGQIAYSFGDFDCYIMTVDFSNTSNQKSYDRHAANVLEPICDNVLLNSLPSVILPAYPKQYHTIFENISSQPSQNNEESRILLLKLLFMLNDELCGQKLTQLKKTRTATDKILQYIHEHFREQLSLEELVELTHLNKSYLIRLFKKHVGIPPMDYLIEYRLDYARNLMLNTGMNIQDIAFACGYNSPSLFTAQFKRKFGITPKKDRQQITADTISVRALP